MKKKIFSIAAVVLFASSNLNATSHKLTPKEEPTLEAQGACQMYADWVGQRSVELGENYYEGWFGAYAHCLEVLGTSGL